MEQKEAVFSYEEFNRKNHRFGRIFLTAAVLLIILVPVVIGLVLGEAPNVPLVLQGLAALLIFLVSGFVEVVTYAPLLGTSGTYLAFFTGNLVNLKVPCAVNARDLMQVRHGSVEGELVSTVAIASSTIVTTLVLALGVLLLRPLTPVLESPALSPAYSTAFTALFGALAYQYFTKDLRLVPIPLILATVLQILTHMGKAALIPVSVVVTVLFAYWLYKKEK